MGFGSWRFKSSHPHSPVKSARFAGMATSRGSSLSSCRSEPSPPGRASATETSLGVASLIPCAAHPTLRGFLIIAAIAAVIVALQLQATLAALYLIAKIAFLLAIAFFCFLLWREHRSDIDAWPGRARAAFYGGAALIVADIAAISFLDETGLDAVAFVLVLAAGGFAMWRTWRDQHTYS